MTIGDRIKELRNGVARKDFGAKFGASRNTVMRYENGTTPPNATFLEALCEGYRVHADWLLLGKGPKHWGEGDGFDELLYDIQEWLDEISKEEPKRKSWFEIELLDKIPLFAEWIKKRNQAQAKSDSRRAA